MVEHQAYLCKQTGKIYLHSDLYEDPDEELPEDLEDGDKYIALPGKRDLDLGKPLASTLRAKFCRATSTPSAAYSANAVPTRSSRTCW